MPHSTDFKILPTNKDSDIYGDTQRSNTPLPVTNKAAHQPLPCALPDSMLCHMRFQYKWHPHHAVRAGLPAVSVRSDRSPPCRQKPGTVVTEHVRLVSFTVLVSYSILMDKLMSSIGITQSERMTSEVSNGKSNRHFDDRTSTSNY